MNKHLWLRIINPVMFLLMISQVVTGMFGRELHLGRTGFEIIHGLGGQLLLLLMFAHLALNWSWVRAQFNKKRAHATAPVASNK